MNKNKVLTSLEKIIPNKLLNQMQYIHCSLVSWWILNWGSQPLKFSEKSAMVFAPHQDDETFACGGMIARKKEQGIPVAIAFLTDGRGSHGVNLDIQNLIHIRQQESLTALGILGVNSSEIHFLNYQDGSLSTLDLEVKQQIITEISELLKLYQPGEVYLPHRKDCHRDHEATYSLVKEAINQAGMTTEIFQYPIWIFWRSPLFILLKLQDIAAAYRFSITSVKEKKQKAITAYPSQIQMLPYGFIKRFLNSEEIFFKSES
ncbi:PIG-L deacetylase family protein [Dolichospermum circinale]|uniref:PIG-L deacetylase family protein n=1 Tax=Dolichospermum circinale TaxID=109265 RepID=UPI000403D0C3|nr:PIG-L family deacetylase [Dolichospermum circinale]MDB9473505.1 PIG-L family deacetylase [Dolichospermum circinale CS-537/11]MDB9477695.1 PIG-L family deacetylase [Dolichospermum circinale CS-537/03]